MENVRFYSDLLVMLVLGNLNPGDMSQLGLKGYTLVVKNYRYDSFAIIPSHLDHLVRAGAGACDQVSKKKRLLNVKMCP